MYEVQNTNALEVDPWKTRGFFSLERQWSSAVEMFEKYMMKWPIEDMRLIQPSIFPMLLPTSESLKEYSEADIERVTARYPISRTELKDHAVNQLMQAVNGLPADIRERVRQEYTMPWHPRFWSNESAYVRDRTRKVGPQRFPFDAIRHGSRSKG